MAEKAPYKLVLFTASFPYGNGEQFLETEICYLQRRFASVILVPGAISGQKRQIPPGIEVDNSLGSYNQHPVQRMVFSAFACLKSSLFYRELLKRPVTIVQLRALKRLVSFMGATSKTHEWLLSYLSRPGFDLQRTLFYTYWLGPQSLALGLAKRWYPEIRSVSRAHGGDLYEERHKPPYLPLRATIFKSVDVLFCISDHGKRYVTSKYTWANNKCRVSRLGVNDPGFNSRYSTDGVFRIVSCSFMVPVKRLDLLIKGLARLGLLRPDLCIEWSHLGDGCLRNHLEGIARECLPVNVKWKFKGQVPNREVISYYRNHPVDVFVNVSASEGIPVSIMEAQSCGIPVIATAVGGTPEIVNDNNGILLEENPSADRIATVLNQLASNQENAIVKRIASKEHWSALYNSKLNYNAFVDELFEIMKYSVGSNGH